MYNYTFTHTHTQTHILCTYRHTAYVVWERIILCHPAPTHPPLSETLEGMHGVDGGTACFVTGNELLAKVVWRMCDRRIPRTYAIYVFVCSKSLPNPFQYTSRIYNNNMYRVVIGWLFFNAQANMSLCLSAIVTILCLYVK